MKKIIGFFILGVTASSFTYPNNLPYKVEEIQKSNKKEIPYDLAEYKIILSDIVDSSNIQVKNITLCSNTKCYNSLDSKKINIKHSTDGTGNETVSYLIPRSEVIERILFEPSTENNANTITGSIRIKDPTDLKLTEQKYDVDIFITLNKNNNILTPIGAVSMFRSPETVNIFYDPRTELISNLPYKVKLKIAKNALSHPQIFNVFVNNEGTNYPSVDIYPKVQFNIPISLTRESSDPSLYYGLSQIFDKDLPKFSPTAINKNTTFEKPQAPSTNLTESTISLTSSGFISNSRTSSYDQKAAQVMAASTETCAAEITRRRSELISQTSANGVVKIDFCVNKPPYVHIALINKLHPSTKFQLEHSVPLNTAENIWGVSMHRLNTFAYDMGSKAKVAMNGFTWFGPPGVIALTPGFSLGYVKSGYHLDPTSSTSEWLSIGINRQQGGFVTKGSFGGFSDGNKFIMKHIVGSPNVTFLESNKLNGVANPKLRETIISSSTSIIKNNVCSSGSNDRWSSIGATNEIMVMISSVSDKKSNSADFCQIYKAFTIPNALRLDGGSSTAMIINGNLLNPNVGSDRFIFGQLRYITYAVKVW